MTDIETKENKTPTIIWRRWYTVLLILFLLILTGILSISINASRQEKKVQAKLDTIRKAGYPITPAELDKWYPAVPADENAAAILETAFRLFVNGPDMQHVPICERYAKVPDRTKHLSPDMKKASIDYLDLNKDAINLLHEGAALPKSRYTIDLSRGYMATLPSLGKVRQGARLLALEALVNADAGNSAAATKDILSILGVARSLDQEPVFISQLVRIACNTLTLANLETDMNLVSFSDSELLKISNDLEQAEKSDGLCRGLVGDRCNGYDAYKYPNILASMSSGGTPSPSFLPSSIKPMLGNIWRSVYRNSGMLAYDFGLYLDYITEYIDACKTPLPKRLEMANEISKKINAVITSLNNNIVNLHVFVKIFPAFDRSFIADARNIAMLRAGQMAIAVERYRIANGKLPADTKDLVPTYLKAIPMDPFDPAEKPLRYAKRNKGFVVYSVGDDGKDDGGTELDATGRKYSRATDITFIIER